MKSRRHEQAEFGPLPGFKRPADRKISGPFIVSEKEAGVPRLSGSHTSRSDPSGLVGRKPSGIPSAAIVRSQGFSQFQLSFPSESRWVPAPAVSGRAEPWHTGIGENGRPAVFPQRALEFTRQRWEETVLVPLEATLERNQQVRKFDERRQYEQARLSPLPGYRMAGAPSATLRFARI